MQIDLWRPPAEGFIKLNFDASFSIHNNLATAAVITRNHEGKIMGACSYLFQNVTDAFLVEAYACEKVVLFAVEMGFWRIEVEGDSLTVIKKLKSWN